MNDLQFERPKFRGFAAYGQSKLLMSAFYVRAGAEAHAGSKGTRLNLAMDRKDDRREFGATFEWRFQWN
jgi:hypothetical protein